MLAQKSLSSKVYCTAVDGFFRWIVNKSFNFGYLFDYVCSIHSQKEGKELTTDTQPRAGMASLMAERLLKSLLARFFSWKSCNKQKQFNIHVHTYSCKCTYRVKNPKYFIAACIKYQGISRKRESARVYFRSRDARRQTKFCCKL